MREILTDMVTTTLMAVFTVGFCILCKNVQMVAGNWLDKMRDEAENENLEVTARMFGTASQLLSGITYNAVAAMEQTKAKDIREKRFISAFKLSVSLAAGVAVVYLLKDNPTIFVNILYIGGILGGFWFWKNFHEK